MILATLFLVMACKPDDTVEITREEYKVLKGDTIKPKYPKAFELYTDGLQYYNNGIVLGSDGHEYIITNYGEHSENMEHYIECEKCLTTKSSRRIVYSDETNQNPQ